MKFFKIRNAEGKYLRGPSRYLWNSNWVKVGKTWQQFSHALAALRMRAPYWEPEQLAGVVIVEISDTGERTLPAKAALDGERFPEMSATEGLVTFVFPNKELLDRFIGYMGDGGGEQGFMAVAGSLDFDYHIRPGFVVVTETEEIDAEAALDDLLAEYPDGGGDDGDGWELTNLKEYP